MKHNRIFTFGLLSVLLIVPIGLRADASFNWDDNIKGLHEATMFQSPGDGLYTAYFNKATTAGIKHDLVAILIDNFLPNPALATSAYYATVGSTTVYFNEAAVNRLDSKILDRTTDGIKTTACIYMTKSADLDLYYDASKQYLNYPNNVEPTVFAFGESALGQTKFRALMKFLMNRYSNDTRRIAAYIIGNEVQGCFNWNNMGPKEYQVPYTVVSQYANVLSIAAQEAAVVNSNIRIFASFDHFWNQANDPGLSGKYVMETLESVASNVPWHVAWHAYPTGSWGWDDGEDADTHEPNYITMKNIEVLTSYLNRPEMRYNGSARRVILSEQGVQDNGEPYTQAYTQAAAYAYYYTRASRTPGIDALHWLYLRDLTLANGDSEDRSSGLVHLETDNTTLTDKPSYSVFRYADSPGSTGWSTYFDPTLATIEPTVQSRSWVDITPYLARPVAGTAHLHALSHRGYVHSGMPIIGGLIISGGTKRVYVRGVGPSMVSLGISNAIMNPTIRVYNSAGVQIAYGENESQVLLDLSDGVYTAHLADKYDATGIGLLEIYEVADLSGSPRIKALSARGDYDSTYPNGQAIASYIVDGTGTTGVMVRALGPALAPYVTNPLGDPQMAICNPYNGKQLAFNDNWEESLNYYDVPGFELSHGMISLATGSLDAALYTRVYAGAYSAVCGATSSNGVKNVMVEIYED